MDIKSVYSDIAHKNVHYEDGKVEYLEQGVLTEHHDLEPWDKKVNMVHYIDFVDFEDINYLNVSIPFEYHHEVKYHQVMAHPKYQLPERRKHQAFVI